MPARIDPFVDVLLRERGEQLYLLPDEPVTMVKDGESRKVSRQPLTDQHIYALLADAARAESAPPARERRRRAHGRGPASAADGPRYCAGAAGRGPGPPIQGGRASVGGAAAPAGPHQVVRPAPPRG